MHKKSINTDNHIFSIRSRYNLSRKHFCKLTGIPYKTLLHWEYGERSCPEYVIRLIEHDLDKRQYLLDRLFQNKIVCRKYDVQGQWFSDSEGYGIDFVYHDKMYRIYCDSYVNQKSEESVLTFAEWDLEDAIDNIVWEEEFE